MTYWWFYEKCNAVLDLCTMTICIMSKSTVFMKASSQKTNAFVVPLRKEWVRVRVREDFENKVN